jgi:hypothetical protein
MRFTFGKVLGNESFKLFKAADAPLINVRAINDDGTPLDVTASTVTLEVYATADRKAAAVKSLTLSVVTAAAGALSLTPTVALMDFGPGTYYAFVKHVLTAGAVVTISTNNVKLVIG